MLSEDKVPLRDRRLMVEGVISQEALELVRAGLPTEWPHTARCFLVSYSYADIPLSKRFEFVSSERHPTRAEATLAIVRAVTQQYGKPFDVIPHGWKTICVIDFPQGIPGLVERLPTVGAWGESTEGVRLCDRDALEAILSERT